MDGRGRSGGRRAGDGGLSAGVMSSRDGGTRRGDVGDGRAEIAPRAPFRFIRNARRKIRRRKYHSVQPMDLSDRPHPETFLVSWSTTLRAVAGAAITTRASTCSVAAPRVVGPNVSTAFGSQSSRPRSGRADRGPSRARAWRLREVHYVPPGGRGFVTERHEPHGQHLPAVPGRARPGPATRGATTIPRRPVADR